MLIKQNSLLLPRNIARLVFGCRIANSILKKDKYFIPSLYNGSDVLTK